MSFMGVSGNITVTTSNGKIHMTQVTHEWDEVEQSITIPTVQINDLIRILQTAVKQESYYRW